MDLIDGAGGFFIVVGNLPRLGRTRKIWGCRFQITYLKPRAELLVITSGARGVVVLNLRGHTAETSRKWRRNWSKRYSESYRLDVGAMRVKRRCRELDSQKLLIIVMGVKIDQALLMHLLHEQPQLLCVETDSRSSWIPKLHLRRPNRFLVG